MIAILLFITISQKQIDAQPIIFDGISDIYASEFIFISTPHGIYTFDRNAVAWGRITAASGLPDDRVDIIGLDEGILWVATPTGLASADVRINDWVTYDSPSRIQGLTFDDQYVWVGGGFGVRRFDKYTEMWEDVAQLVINHMLSEEDYLWFATDSGVFRYNRAFEKIEKVQTAPLYHFIYIINTPGRIWFIAINKFVSYEKEGEQWSIYEGFEINDYSNVGDSLFVLCNDSVYFYDPKIDNWSPYRDIHLSNVNGIFTHGENILFATDNGLYIYNWQERSRKLYNRSNGLETDSLIDVYQDTKYTYVLSQYDIEFLDPENDLWQVEVLKPSAQKKKQLFYLDEAGGHMNLLKNIDIKLQGYAYYSQSHTIRDSRETTDHENINLRLVGQHNSNRLLSIYYDDTDKNQIMYGLGYRGLNKDLLYRINGGYLKSEYFQYDIIPQFSTLGGNMKLRYKTHSINLQAGQLKSRLKNDFFTGRSSEKRLLLDDIDYLKSTFYYIYGTPQLIEQGTDTIFVDDQYVSTNKIDTRKGFTIGGIIGDFDPLINGIDYFIDYERGIIHFLNRREELDIIVLLLNGEEIVIQSDSVPAHVLENVYFIEPNIIPYSFSMIITDTLGQVHSLDEFGLDDNGDNRVDAEFINHDLGYLFFPQSRPFPDEVYDDMLNIYTMEITFLSQSTFYYLSYSPILIGSEKVYIDGNLMTRSTHYTIDYTSGRLFVQEDIVSDFSEIEIQYSSVEREREDIFHSIQPVISNGDNISIAPGFSVIEDDKIGHISGKLQTRTQGDLDFKFIPQIALNSENEWAQDYAMIAHYKIVSINTAYRLFSRDFESFGAHEKKYGTLQQSGAISGIMEPLSYVRLEGQLKREYQVDSLDVKRRTQYAQGKISYLNPRYPSGHIVIAKDYLPDYEKEKFQVNANYNFKILKSSMKINSMLRNVNVESNANNKQTVKMYIINTNFALPVPVRGDIYFRSNKLSTNNIKEKNEDEIRGTLYIDLIPGLYYIGNYRLETTSFYYDTVQNLTLHNYFYNNLNIAPGRWTSQLNVVNFAFGLGTNFEEYMRNLSANFQRPYVIFSPLEDGTLSRISSVNNYYITAQLTPFRNILIWGKHSSTQSRIAYYSVPDFRPSTGNEARIEFEPADLGFFTVSWKQKFSEGYPKNLIHDVFGEWKKPWSASLRTKLTTHYRLSKDDYGTASAQNSEIKTDFETLLRFTAKSFITIHIGAAKQKDYLNDINYLISPGATINLNLFTFLYLQFNYESTLTIDHSTTHVVTAKMTGQF